jgi:general secretion pathway protein G
MTPQRTRPSRFGPSGFTLIELLVTLALVGVLAVAAMPLVEVTYRRMKESELKLALRTIRKALDDHRAAVDAGQLPRGAGESGYPASLEALTQPLPLSGPAAGQADGVRTLVLLRRLPRDPFHTDPATPAAQTWRTRPYGSRSDEWRQEPGTDVFDVSSSSPGSALDGSRHDQW